MHPLLRRQLKKLRFDDEHLWSESLKKLLDVVNSSYEDADADRKLLENMLQISSTEMQGLYEKLKLESQKELESSEKKYKALIKNIEKYYFFYSYDAKGNVTYVSDSATDILGYDKKEFVEGLDRYFSDDRINEKAKVFASLSKQGEVQEPYECSVFSKDNKLYYLEITEVPIIDKDGNLESVEGIVRDITKYHEAQYKIEHMAMHDSLTGLCNRACLYDQLDIMISAAKRSKQKFAVLFLDLDRFKYINDTLGHDIGDMLLKNVSQRLLHMIRKDDVISRIGGDEFVMVLNNVDEKSLLGIVNKILKLLRTTWNIEHHELHVTSSIGIAMYPDDGETRKDLMKHADMAMYHAKELGRDNVSFFTDSINDVFHFNMHLEQEMSSALKNGQFELHYQPKIELKSNHILGAEALIRWNHPTLGLIMPESFISLAESTGFIVKLGEWVVKEACQTIARLNAITSDESLNFSINVSTRQFQLGDIYTILESSLREANIKGSQLSLEITESIMFNNDEKMIATLTKIKALGIKIFMDDFGLGYSSLSYLNKLPIDNIKIDKAFISDIPKDGSKNALLDAICAMGEALDMDIIAEGVEEENQHQYLLARNCYAYQGFLYSKALPEDMFIEILKQSVFKNN